MDNKEPSSNFLGTWLRSYREAIGYGLREFASEMGLSPSSLSAMELGHRGVPKSFDWLKAADLLGLKPDSQDWKLFYAMKTACQCDTKFLEARVATLEKEIERLKKNVLTILP